MEQQDSPNDENVWNKECETNNEDEAIEQDATIEQFWIAFDR